MQELLQEVNLRQVGLRHSETFPACGTIAVVLTPDPVCSASHRPCGLIS